MQAKYDGTELIKFMKVDIRAKGFKALKFMEEGHEALFSKKLKTLVVLDVGKDNEHIVIEINGDNKGEFTKQDYLKKIDRLLGIKR